MTILSCRTGLTAPSEASMPLFIVQKRRFNAFAAAQADSQQSWLKTTKFSANAGQFTFLPDQNGNMGSAVVVMGKRLCGILPKQPEIFRQAAGTLTLLLRQI